jgi:tetratricopeptide (TPR) repeat protein
MSISTGFLIYTTLFRLTIIAVGAVSIYLGYRLFVKDPIGQGKSSTIAEAGGFKLTLKNFWPGAYFALFGTVIIGIMLWQGNPQLIMREFTEAKDADVKGQTTVARHTEIRGSETDQDIKQYWNLLGDANSSLGQAVKPLAGIAKVWQAEQRTGEALAFARLAARIDPTNAENMALLAELFMANGESDKALQAMQTAAEYDAYYRQALSIMQGRITNKE